MPANRFDRLEPEEPPKPSAPADASSSAQGDLPCPRCGALNETAREVCWECCRPLRQDGAPKAITRASAPYATSDPALWKDFDDSPPDAGKSAPSPARRLGILFFLGFPIFWCSMILYLGARSFWGAARDEAARLAPMTTRSEAVVREVLGDYLNSHGRISGKKAKIAFTADAGREAEFTPFFSPSVDVRAGMKFPVLYDPAHPDRYSLREADGRPLGKPFFADLFIVVWAAIPAAVILRLLWALRAAWSGPS